MFFQAKAQEAPADDGRQSGVLLWETWHSVEGAGVAELVAHPSFAGPADRVQFLAGSSTPLDWTGNLGTRLSGFIVPLETGDYDFAITSAHAAELWLSPTDSWLAKKRVAFSERWGEPNPWDLRPAQSSGPVRLEAGKAYYVEVLQKDVAPPGWVTLRWKKPGAEDFTGIAPEYLASPGTLAADADRDFLADDWSAQVQLRLAQGSPAAGGPPPAPAALTQFADPDRDGLANQLEALQGSDPLERTSLAGSLTREWWFNLDGDSVTGARAAGVFLRPPSQITFTRGAASDRDITDWFACRLRGSVTAPVSGSYRFWIAGDDHCELWLSSDGTKCFKRKLAEVAPLPWEDPEDPAWTGQDSWDELDSQVSPVIELNGGSSYFLEILHKAGGIDNHVSVAWQYRPAGSAEWSERVPLPAAAITSYAGDDDDRDDDYLPDSWESQKGLDPTDNGLRDRARQGEDGDFDSDKLSNRVEFLRGTDPCQADSDGDGIGDYEEIHVYDSDPVRQDASLPVKVAGIPLTGYQAEPGQWFAMPDGTLRSLQRRGPVAFAFEVEQPGVYLLELAARVGANGDYAPPVPVIARVDGTEVGRGNIEKAGTTWRWLTPWLPAGSHTVTLDNRNVRLGLTLDIVHLDLYRHEGEDADGNALPDWMEGLFRRSSQLDSSFVESAVSPFCVEGVWRFPGDAGLAAAGEPVAVKAGLAGRWYADVPLAVAGETPVEARFEHGALKQVGNLRWKETNLLATAEELRIRVGDSLKLVAIPAGTDGAQTQVLYSLGQEALGSTQPGNQPRVVKFSEPGNYTLKAATTTGSETLNAEVEVEVLAADFGAPFSVAGMPRIWSLPGVPHALSVEADAELTLDPQPLGLENPLTYQVSYPVGQAGQPAVLARLWSGGPVVSATRVNAFSIVSATQTLDSRLVQVLPDGTRVVEFAILIEGLIPADFSLWIDLYVTDALFADGSTRYYLTAADFDAGGIARILVYKAPGTGTAWICHWLHPYQEEESAPAGE